MRLRTVSVASTLVAALAFAHAAVAQTSAAPMAGSSKATASKSASGRCMRLPLSDIAFGREATIAQARMRLDEYAEAERSKRGWGKLTKSRETADCEVYLVLPFLGTEYKCLVTATFCAK